MLQQLTDRVFFLPCDPSTDRPCLGYLRGDRFSVMIDAGNSPAHAALLLEELRGVGLPRPRFVALTHWHWDHTFGLPGLDAAAAACSRTGRMLERMLGWKWDDASMAERLRAGEDILFCDEMIRREYPDRGKIALRPPTSSMRTGWTSSPADAPVGSCGWEGPTRTTVLPRSSPKRACFSLGMRTARTCTTGNPTIPARPPSG